MFIPLPSHYPPYLCFSVTLGECGGWDLMELSKGGLNESKTNGNVGPHDTEFNYTTLAMCSYIFLFIFSHIYPLWCQSFDFTQQWWRFDLFPKTPRNLWFLLWLHNSNCVLVFVLLPVVHFFQHCMSSSQSDLCGNYSQTSVFLSACSLKCLLHSKKLFTVLFFKQMG